MGRKYCFQRGGLNAQKNTWPAATLSVPPTPLTPSQPPLLSLHKKKQKKKTPSDLDQEQLRGASRVFAPR